MSIHQAIGTLPVLDFSAYGKNRENDRAFLDQLAYAAREVGFFYLTGHGISQSLIDDVLGASRRFFALPATFSRWSANVVEYARPLPASACFSMRVTRKLLPLRFIRWAARMTPVAPPPTMTIDLRGVSFISAAPGRRGQAESRLGVLLQFRQQVVDPDIAQLREAAVVEHLGDRGAHIEHYVSNLACRLIAIFATLISGPACAGDRSERAVENTDDG